MTEKSLCLNPADQTRVLAKLRELRDSGAELRPTSLARKLRIPEAYIAPTLQTLQRKGYIRSGDHPKTGLRVKYLSEFARLPDEPPPPTIQLNISSGLKWSSAKLD